jgi:hypothetical protein
MNFLKELSETSPCLYFEYLTQIVDVRLVEVYLKLQKFQKAEKVLKETIQRHPKDIECTNLKYFITF